MRLGHRACWTLNLYPDAAEAGGCFLPTLRSQATGSGATPEPGRAQAEAARRARAKLRRYCAANRLNRLWTLTYAGDGCFDPGELRSDLAGFFRGLRREVGTALPYVWVPEWHPGGHGLHVHFAADRFVRHAVVKDVWGRGIVHVKRIGSKATRGDALERARITAGYLAKYVSKSIDGERVPGLHRYEVAQGFQPDRVPLTAATPEAVLALASERMGSPPRRRWESNEVEGWLGPPAYWYAW